MFLFESFEPRQMLTTIAAPSPWGENPVSAQLTKGGVLRILGGGARDTIVVEQLGTKKLRIKNPGGVHFLTGYGRKGNQLDLSLVKEIVINAGGGKDSVSVLIREKRITALVDGDNGNDTLVAVMSNATLLGNAGDDYLVSDSLREIVKIQDDELGNAEAPSVPIVIDATRNVLDGGSGADRLASRGAEDSLLGSDGNDTFMKLNALQSFTGDLPAMTTKVGPSRAAVFGIASIVESQSDIEVKVRRTNFK